MSELLAPLRKRYSIRFLGERFAWLVGGCALVLLLAALSAGGIHELIQSEIASMGSHLGIELAAVPVAAIAGGVVSGIWPRRVARVHDREDAPLLWGALLTVLVVWLWLVWAGVDLGVATVVGRVVGGVVAATLAFAGAMVCSRLAAILAGVIAGAGLFGGVELCLEGAVFSLTAAHEGGVAGAYGLTLFAALVVLVLAALFRLLRLPTPLVLGMCSGVVGLVVAVFGYLAAVPLYPSH